MYTVSQKVFFTIKETCEQENLPESAIQQMMADPRFAALSLIENGKILIAEGALDALKEARKTCPSVAGQFPEMPQWNWNLPNVKYLRRSDLEALFGISRATSYTLIHSSGFPTDPTIRTRIYIQTDELKK